MSTYPVGMNKWELDTPSLCLDAAALERNIARMAAFLAGKPVALRPHCKTHKCPTIAWKQLEAGAIGITCAKLGEAEVMARAGIKDLLIANQIVGPRKISRLVNLAAYTRLIVAVEDAQNVAALAAAAEAKGIRLRVIIEVDVGMGRCGVSHEQPVLDLARQIVSLPALEFEGIMGYEGQMVLVEDFEERTKGTQEAMAKLISARDILVSHDIPVGIVSAAGTGTYEITSNYPGVTELQLGSYATMDARYASVGIDYELALSVVAQVISAKVPGKAVIDAGLKTLTPEFGMPRVKRPEGWEMIYLSEEHGFVECKDGEMLHLGDIVEIIPAHGCTTINLHDACYVTRDDVVAAVGPIAARGCIR